MTRVIGPPKSRRRGWWYGGATLATAIFFVVFFVASSGANLGGSTFEGNDGNLAVNTSGNTDWANVAGLSKQADLTTGTGDNSFGQGSKENASAVTVVSGSIPPNKSDLTRFYEASELGSNGHAYLYLAWERSNVLGNANMDFEIEQSGNTACPGTPGPCTLSRTSGDILVTYDFGGSGSPVIGLRTWNGSSWVVDTTTVVAEAKVNDVTVTDPISIASDNGNHCPAAGCVANTFGEAAIDLTASGFSQSDLCKFGQASTFLKSRSSSSFTSEIKDFIAPVKTPVANLCGSITITKVTDPAAADVDFGYSTTGGLTPSTFSLNAASPANGNSNTITYSNITPGNYTVNESTIPSGWGFGSLSCTPTGTGTTAAQDGTTETKADITLGNNGTASCTYTNNELTGAIEITKTSSKGLHPGLAGATFSITKDGTAISGSPFTTAGTDGTVCVDGLAFGDYVVTETAAPTGYGIDDTTGHTVTVDTGATCSSSTGIEAFGATDTPLTDLVVTATGEASPAGTTNSQITCVDANSADIGDSPSQNTDPASVTANGLAPGTYTCTVVVDP
jgi:hypothetical protein